MIFSSKSSPPSLLSPAVANTSKVPSAKSKIETSNVPPPKSYTNTFCSWSNLSNPNAKAAAVGSLIIRSTSKPAILPASFVAWRCSFPTRALPICLYHLHVLYDQYPYDV